MKWMLLTNLINLLMKFSHSNYWNNNNEIHLVGFSSQFFFFFPIVELVMRSVALVIGLIVMSRNVTQCVFVTKPWPAPATHHTWHSFAAQTQTSHKKQLTRQGLMRRKSWYIRFWTHHIQHIRFSPPSPWIRNLELVTIDSGIPFGPVTTSQTL